MIGKSYLEVFPELKSTPIEEKINQVLSDPKPIDYEMYFPPAQRWYQTQGYATREGALLIFRDITARKSQSA